MPNPVALQHNEQDKQTQVSLSEKKKPTIKIIHMNIYMYTYTIYYNSRIELPILTQNGWLVSI